MLWALVVQRLALSPARALALACVFAPLIATPINQASRLSRRRRRQTSYDRASPSPSSPVRSGSNKDEIAALKCFFQMADRGTVKFA